MFAGSFVAQWGIGVIADVARVSAGLSVAEGLRVAFVVVLALHRRGVRLVPGRMEALRETDGRGEGLTP